MLARYIYCVGSFLLLVLAPACSRNGCPSAYSPPAIEPAIVIASNAMQEVSAFVAIGPRYSGSAGARKSAEHILQRMKSFNIPAVIDEFEDGTPSGPVTFRNVLATIKGSSERSIVLLSHYDTKAGIGDNFVGANDSGSSTGLLIEMARALKQMPMLFPTIILAFVDGEEAQRSYGPNDGLHGSARLAKKFKASGKDKDIDAVIVLDMIGDKDFNLLVPRNSSPNLAAMLFEAAKAEKIRNKVVLMEGMMYDDHVPFLDQGIKAVDIIDFTYTDGSGKNYWHTEMDTLDKLSAESLALSGRLAIRMINGIVKETIAAPGQD